jgi:hypothetical protein
MAKIPSTIDERDSLFDEYESEEEDDEHGEEDHGNGMIAALVTDDECKSEQADKGNKPFRLLRTAAEEEQNELPEPGRTYARGM